ncbi:MAG: HIT family protein [Acidimicrobiia bacterium]
MVTIFTRIIDGEIPGTFVWRDDECVAFMSINPLRSGHTLVVPRQEVDLWTDCPPELRNHLFEVSQTIAKAIQQVYSPERVGLMIAGLDVPHLHIHLVPIDGVRDLDFANAASSVDREELDESARSIRQVMTSQGARGVSD